MDIGSIDAELNVKMKEVFKSILKDRNVKIFFDEVNSNTDIVESFSINHDNHFFNAQKLRYKLSNFKINEKYYPLLSKKLKDKINNIPNNEKLKVFKKYCWYLKVFKPFYGSLILSDKNYYFIYQLTYNSITIDLTKIEFERFLYYTKYVYKIQQIIKLNKELNIEQNFKIVFDDDKAAHEMYNNLYKNFKDIIKPFRNDDLKQ